LHRGWLGEVISDNILLLLYYSRFYTIMQQSTPPDLARVKQRAARVEEICKRADAGILILDEIIADLDQQIRSSSRHSYRLKRAKNLLDQV